MSSVTSIILACECSEGDDTMAPINAYFEAQGRKGLTKIDEFAGGGNAMQISVYAGAFNYLDHDEFARAVKACKFEWPEAVVLLVNGEHDDTIGAVTLNKPTDVGRRAADEIEAVFREIGDSPATPFEYRPSPTYAVSHDSQTGLTTVRPVVEEAEK